MLLCVAGHRQGSDLSIMMCREEIYLSLGANIGDRFSQLHQALSLLAPEVEISDCSSIYETEPWGFRPQPAFLNLVCRGYTQLTPEDLLACVRGIEKQIGRRHLRQRYGPRVIDIDILFYSQRVLCQSNLCIPHPRLVERAFVLVPLVELAPNFLHPSLRRTVRQLQAVVDDKNEVCLWAPPPCLGST